MTPSSVDGACLLAALVTSTLVKFGVMLGRRRRPSAAQRVGQVSQLWIYPVKSCRGIRLQSANLTHSGLQLPGKAVLDRHFMVVTESYRFVSMRHKAELALVRIGFHDDMMHVDAPEMATLVLPLDMTGPRVECGVWDNRIRGVDCGDEAARWLTAYLKQPVRFVYTSDAIETRGIPLLGDSKWHRITSHHHKVGFQDFAPYLLTSDASLRDLNGRLASPITMERFRPNLVVDGNMPPFDEDEWLEIYIGEHVRLTNLKPCGRCVMTTIDPELAVRDAKAEPLETLKTYRMELEVDKSSPMFGINVFLDWPGTVHQGDDVYIIRGKPPRPQ